MHITILKKKDFDQLMRDLGINDQNVEAQANKFFISILNTSDYDTQSWFHNDHPNVTRLFFDDIEHQDESPRGVLFAPKHAQKVLNIVGRMNDQSEVFVHCSAGISRSTAVGSFIGEKFGVINDPDRFVHGPSFYPNAHVLGMLRRMDKGQKV